MKQASDHYGSMVISRHTFPIAENTVLWNGAAIFYFCGRKKEKSMPNRNILYASAARKTGIPTTHSGLERKLGRMLIELVFGKRK